MNFFAAQDQARSRTRLLLVLFGCAVLALLVLTNLLVVITAAVLTAEEGGELSQQIGQQLSQAAGSTQPLVTAQLPWPLILITSLVVLAVISIVVLLKQQQLKQGGKVVAKALGGRRLQGDESNPKLRQLHNVVAEMAIASGVPVPPVYLLPEPGINAFAAGWTSADAVIGVTEGCVAQLSRDELQGVIAHEFSHILNGDMQLNIRLLALLHGILFISEAGSQILQFRPRSSGNKDSAVAAVLLLGVGLLVVGYLGVFFAQLIKAAVSREREYLADASAVQFTRNPAGIAGALKRIAANAQGGRVQHAGVTEMSHLFFANALSPWQSGLIGWLFATHPPLSKRIRRLDPQWNGQYQAVSHSDTTAECHATAADHPAGSAAASNQPHASQTNSSAAQQQALLAALLQRLNSLAPPTQQRQTQPPLAANLVAQLQAQLQQLPAVVQQAWLQPAGARALLLCALMSDAQLPAQLRLLKAADPALPAQLDPLLDSLLTAHPLLRLMLLQQAAPALKRLSACSQQELSWCCQQLILQDQQLSTLETVIWLWLSRLLPDAAAVVSNTAPQIKTCQSDIRLLLQLVSQQVADPDLQQQALASGMAALGIAGQTIPPTTTQTTTPTTTPDAQLEQLTRVAAVLAQINGQEKQQLWHAVVLVLQADQQPTEHSLLWLHTLALLLDVPLSPLPLSR